MQAIKEINSGLVPQPSAGNSLARTSALRLTDYEVDALELLMAQTQARYPNQELPEGTPAMYGVLWAELAERFGLRTFTAALSRVIRVSKFFPDPVDISAECSVLHRAAEESAKTARLIREADEARAQWQRERAEDLANGREKTEAELRLDALLVKTKARNAMERPYFGPPAVHRSFEEIKALVDFERAGKTEERAQG